MPVRECVCASAGAEKIRMFYDEGFARRPPTASQSVDKQPEKGIFWTRNTLADRLLARKCEWCGIENVAIEMHHVRKLKNLSGKNQWERVMQSRRRKTMALCRDCHVKLHKGTLS